MELFVLIRFLVQAGTLDSRLVWFSLVVKLSKP